jgi:Sulfotransferase family
MPIFRINDQLHYFAHVPKCGGSSVNDYLTQRFGPLAFNEPGRHNVPDSQRWNRSASQHIPLAALDRLVPRHWFASSFAVVRHPVRRVISAYFYARDVGSSVPLGTGFDAWVTTAFTWIDTDPHRRASHVLPQSDLVPEDAHIFRLEDGLELVVPYLDTLAGNAEGPRQIPTRNVGKWRHDEAPPAITAQTLALINRIYAADYARFGYTVPTTAADALALADLPVLAATGTPPVPQRRTFVQRVQRSLMRRAGM